MKKLIFFLLFMSNISAQDKSFTISTNFDTIYLGNYLEVKFTATNVDGKFSEPSFPGLNVIAGPNTFKSTSIMNGEKHSSSSYSYFIKPEEIGVYIIDVAKLETEDKILKTKEKKIVVLPNPNNIIQSKEESDQNDFEFLGKPDPVKVKSKKKTFKI